MQLGQLGFDNVSSWRSIAFTLGGTAERLLAAFTATNRQGVLITNTSNEDLYVGFDDTVSTTHYVHKIAANMPPTEILARKGVVIWVYTATTGKTRSVAEVS